MPDGNPFNDHLIDSSFNGKLPFDTEKNEGFLEFGDAGNPAAAAVALSAREKKFVFGGEAT